MISRGSVVGAGGAGWEEPVGSGDTERRGGDGDGSCLTRGDDRGEDRRCCVERDRDEIDRSGDVGGFIVGWEARAEGLCEVCEYTDPYSVTKYNMYRSRENGKSCKELAPPL